MLWGAAHRERRAILRGPAVYPGHPSSVFVPLTAITPGTSGRPGFGRQLDPGSGLHVPMA